MKRIIFLLLVSSIVAAVDGSPQDSMSIAEKTAQMVPHPGYFTYYWDASQGKIWLSVDRWNEEFLYVNALSTGIGSNDIGLDRGQLGSNRVVEFRRYGPRVLLVHKNYDYRAVSDNLQERRAVEEAFANSVLGGWNVAAASGDTVLIDITDFLLRDAHGISARLSDANQGDYGPDPLRSAVMPERTRNFSRNTEFEVLVTFKGKPAGSHVRQVVPSPDAITVRQRHSFIMLPDDGYQPRRMDVRCGSFGIEYLDYATPIESPIRKHFIARHRLHKKGGGSGEAEEPIIYYVDSGAPEPIRSALIDGAQWWAEAFEALGFRNAFRVEVMPDTMDPLDARYNVIQWVHRSTRGWSYGGGVIDPRTGEIIKGHVTLGSLRVRQDFMIAEGLLAPYDSRDGVPAAMTDMALARLRQLSAHEVGHTLGLTHNFAASGNDRASVMDYPHPLVGLDANGGIDLAHAYDSGIGAWDRVAIAYAYSEYAGDEREEDSLDAILARAYASGLRYISDADARPPGSAHAYAHLWDNDSDAAAQLEHVLAVRKAALTRFGENNIPTGRPYAALEEVLVPIYFFHRYQAEAAVKLVGGVDYRYAVRGEQQTPFSIIPAQAQNRALAVLLRTIDARELTPPAHLVALMTSRTSGSASERELFQPRTGLTFDAIGAAEAAAAMTLRLLLHPERAARLIEYHARDEDLPGLETVIGQVLGQSLHRGPESLQGLRGEVQKAINMTVLHQMMDLFADERSSAQTRAIVLEQFNELEEKIRKFASKSKKLDQRAHYRLALFQLEAFREDPNEFAIPKAPEPPAGSPIGCAAAP